MPISAIAVNVPFHAELCANKITIDILIYTVFGKKEAAVF